jgi:hypothetical protein
MSIPAWASEEQGPQGYQYPCLEGLCDGLGTSPRLSGKDLESGLFEPMVGRAEVRFFFSSPGFITGRFEVGVFIALMLSEEQIRMSASPLEIKFYQNKGTRLLAWMQNVVR